MIFIDFVGFHEVRKSFGGFHGDRKKSLLAPTRSEIVLCGFPNFPRGQKMLYVVPKSFHDVENCFTWFPKVSTKSKIVVLGFQFLHGVENCPSWFSERSTTSKTVPLGLQEVGNCSTWFARGRKLVYLLSPRSEIVLLGIHEVGNCFTWCPRHWKLFCLVPTRSETVLFGFHGVGNCFTWYPRRRKCFAWFPPRADPNYEDESAEVRDARGAGTCIISSKVQAALGASIRNLVWVGDSR